MSAVTPGLVCSHHHLYSALARGMPAPPQTPTTFLQILEQVWWRLDVALDLDMIEWSAKLAAVEALESGTTAIADVSANADEVSGGPSARVGSGVTFGAIATGGSSRFPNRRSSYPRSNRKSSQICLNETLLGANGRLRNTLVFRLMMANNAPPQFPES